MRDEYFAKGTGPTVRMLGKTSGVSVKELYQLFPTGPAKTAARHRRHPEAPRLHLIAPITPHPAYERTALWLSATRRSPS